MHCRVRILMRWWGGWRGEKGRVAINHEAPETRVGAVRLSAIARNGLTSEEIILTYMRLSLYNFVHLRWYLLKK